MPNLLLAAFAASSVFATPTADFTQTSGKFRRELHSSGFGPMICSCPQESIDAIKSMHFLNARTHDWALLNSAERVCDYYHIFPLMHLDAKDPKNYHFGPTDYLLKRTREETGLGIFYRLGTSIEHSGAKVHFNTLIPEDFDKVAETFAGTIRHYNKGWANGFDWNIRYWEIWNEPDGGNNMWCEPGGDTPQNEAGRRAKFVKFFVTVLKRLKSEFPDVKVGGPALCWMNPAYFKELLKACKDAGVAPDFISWHSYSNDPDAIMRAADDARKICDSFGFTQCELIINEWHYFGNYTWGELRSPNPEVQARVLDGPRSHNGIEAAAFTLATLAKFQTSKYDQAYYYGCRHNGSWGFKDYREQKYKTYYALKMFGGLAKDYPVICPVTGAAKGDPTVFAVKSADGARSALLVVDYKGKSRTLTVNVKGVDGKKVVAKVLDDARNIETCAADLQGETLKLEKMDGNSAAFLVTFRDETPDDFAGSRLLDPDGKAYLGFAAESAAERPVSVQKLDRTYADGLLRLTADILAPAKWAGEPGRGTSLRVGLAPAEAVREGIPATIGEFGPDYQNRDGLTKCFALSRDAKSGRHTGCVMAPCRPGTWYRYVCTFDLAKGVYSGAVCEAETGKPAGSFGPTPFCRALDAKKDPVAAVTVSGFGMTSGLGDDFVWQNAGGADNLKLEWQAPGATEWKTVFTCDYRTRMGAAADQPLTGAAEVASRMATVDFGAATGKVNKWLHCAGWGPRSYPRSLENDDAALKALNLTAGRTHDWALVNDGQRIVDTQYLFPLMNQDPSNPGNYVFEPTDHVLELAQNIGLKIFYRLGTSIEHTGDWSFNANNPKDHAKYAEALAGIVRHYTQGWGNGFKWDIQNWEIYNEPNIKPCWRGTKEEFLDLYVTSLKRLKSEFPHLSIGGPAFAGCPMDYMKDLLAACRSAGVAPDFMSWHYYGQNPSDLVAQPAKVRKLLDEMGFPKCRTVINEWHYIVSWDGIHGASSVERIKKAHSGPSAHNGIDSAVFNLAVLAGFQNTCLDQAYYYGSGARGNWGYKDGLGLFNKSYYSLKLFGEIVAGYADKVAAMTPAPSVTVFAAKSADGRKGCLLVADYRGRGRLAVDVKGVAHPKNVKAVVLDHTRDLEPVVVDWKDGRLTLPRKDANSAAFLVTFDL